MQRAVGKARRLVRRRGRGRLPDFLIVGAMKAATTSLAAWLRSHPQIFIPEEKELRFFHHPPTWERGVDWYKAQFADAQASALAGEATPEYMLHRFYVERMATVVPDAKLIVMLRNPVDRAYSNYLHIYDRGDEQRSFLEAITDELQADPTDWRNCGRPLARGRYIEHLETLTSFYDRSRIYVGLFDDLSAQPHAFFSDVCRFLGVDPDVIPDAVGRSFDPTELIDPKLQGKERPVGRKMSGEERDVVRTYYRPFNERLEVWLGRDLSSWNE